MTRRGELPAYARTWEEADRIRAQIRATVATWPPLTAAEVAATRHLLIGLIRPHRNDQEAAA